MTAMTEALRPQIVFYSDFPLGYHNREAEEKMSRFARRGFPVVYVEQLGIRNPRPHHAVRLARLLLRRPGRAGERALERPFQVLSPKLLAPRRAPLVAGINRRWLARQLLAPLDDPSAAIFWVRFPTPELIAVLDQAQPRLVVYESVDDHAAAPGMTPRLLALYRDAEAELLARSGLVFAWSEPLRAALAERHPHVVLASAAVDVDRFAPLATVAPDDARIAAYTGSIDFRFDAELVRAAAEQLPDWTFVLAGPLIDRDAGYLGRLANVELLGPVAADAVPDVLARSSVCLMPYRRNEFADKLFPIKLIEYLAAGRPVVATPIEALRGFDDVVATASTPQEFAAGTAAVAAADSPDKRQLRCERARPYSWEVRIDGMERAIDEALARG